MAEHPALREIVHALEQMGVRFRDEHAVRPCSSCKRTRRWQVAEIAHKRVMNLLLCNECLRKLNLATTNRSEIIIT